jgi:hypothetical protein
MKMVLSVEFRHLGLLREYDNLSFSSRRPNTKVRIFEFYDVGMPLRIFGARLANTFHPR